MSRSVTKIVLLFVGTCLSLPYVLSAITAPSIKSELQASTNPLFERLNLDLDIDPRLQIMAKYFDADLSPRSCFMNAIEALALLAVMDYDGVIPETTFSTPGYTDVEIDIRPARYAQNLLVKYAVLGLYYAIVAMALEPAMARNFKIATFGVEWEGVVVAWIWIQVPHLANENQTRKLTAPHLGNLLDLKGMSPIVHLRPMNNAQITNNTNGTNPTNADVELTMTFFPQGVPLTERGVYIAVLATLKDVAEFPSTQLVDPFEIGSGASEVTIQWDRASAARLTGPPSFEYRWIVEAAKQIPVWMIQRRFWETFFTITVNDIVIGEGAVRRGKGQV